MMETILDRQEEMRREEACRIPTEQDDIPFILPANMSKITNASRVESVQIDNIDAFLKLHEMGVRFQEVGAQFGQLDFVLSVRDSNIGDPLIGVTDTSFDRVSLWSVFGSLNPLISFRASPWVFSPGATITTEVENRRGILGSGPSRMDFSFVGTILRRRRPLPLKLPADAIPYAQTLSFSSITGNQTRDQTFPLNIGEFNFVMTAWGFGSTAGQMLFFLRDEVSGQPFMTERRVHPQTLVRHEFQDAALVPQKLGPSVFRLPTWWFIPTKGSLFLEIENLGLTQPMSITVFGFRTRKTSLEEAVS